MRRDSLAILLLLAATAAQAAPVPKDIAQYAARVEACDHWAGEEPYDKARAADIARALQELRCNVVARDGRSLRRRYRHDPVAMKALRAADDETL